MTRTIFVNGCQVEINHDGTSIFVDGKVIKTYLQSKGSKRKNSGKFYRCSIGGKPYLVHRLVAQAFIPNPENLPYVTHIDTNTENNDYRNLWWGNQRTIVWHMKSAGRSYKTVSNERVNSKIPFEKIPEVVNMICNGLTLKQIGEKFNTTEMSIHRIKKRYCGSLTIVRRSSMLSLKEIYAYAKMMEYDAFCSFIAKRMGGIPETACPKNFINNLELREKECADAGIDTATESKLPF